MTAGPARAALAFAALALPSSVAGPALAQAPGWSTPKVATAEKVSEYAAGPDGQGVELFAAPGAVQTRTAQMRAITSSAGEGTAVPVNPAGPDGVGETAVSVNASGRLVAAWSLDAQQQGPIGLAAALGARSALPRSAIVLPTTGSVSSLDAAIAADGTATVAWVDGDAAGAVRAATMRPGQPPQVATLATSTVPLGSLAVGPDGRAAVLYGVPSGNGLSARALLRSTSGAWGQSRTIGPAGARRISGLGAGVDAHGRAVALWGDASASSSAPTRILTARSSSASDPLGAYHQIAQRSGDTGCTEPQLVLSSSGDGLGSWLCNAGASARGQPRLARLTKAS